MDMSSGVNKHQEGFVIFLIPIIIIVVLIIIFTSGGGNNTDQATKSDKKETIAQSDAESYCKDSALLGKYLNLDKISIISISDYNVQYQDDGATFNKDGYPIKNLQWTGKNKDTDEGIRFSCWVSGPKDKTTLHWLTANSEDLYGSADFEFYNKEGKKTD